MDRGIFLLVFLSVIVSAAISVLASYCVINKSVPSLPPPGAYNIYFVPEPTSDNPDHGYLQIDGDRYLQLYTTTQVEEGNIPPGSHYHRIDVLGKR